MTRGLFSGNGHESGRDVFSQLHRLRLHLALYVPYAPQFRTSPAIDRRFGRGHGGGTNMAGDNAMSMLVEKVYYKHILKQPKPVEDETNS